MQAIEDVLTSTVNFRFIGRTLSKRPGGKVAASFIIIALIYVIINSISYTKAAGDFIDIALDVAKPNLPTFDITNGILTMHSEEPYVFTHEEGYALLYESALRLDEKRYNTRFVKDIEREFQKVQAKNEKTFCFVIDTTDTYKNRLNLDDYSGYVVITKDSIETVDRVNAMPGNKELLAEKIKQSVRFTPDSADLLKVPAARFIKMIIIVGLSAFALVYFPIKALIAAFVIWLILLIIKKEKPFEVLYKIAIYALSPVLFLSIIHRLWLTIPGPIFQIVYIACIITAVLAIPKPKK